jgi:hypothetical protein
MTEKPETKLNPVDILDNMGTDAPVFVGFSPRGPVNEAVEIKRWGQFIVKFGSFKKCGYLATSVNGFFINGGKRCYVLSLGERPEDLEEVKKRFNDGLSALNGREDIPFILSPGENDLSIHETILDYCEGKGTYALLDGPEELIEIVKEEPNEAIEEGEEVEKKIEADLEEDATTEEEKYENMPSVEGNNGLVIYPWIYLKDRVLGDFYIPPTGHVAGILSRLYTDNERPGFSTINGTVLLRYKFTSEEIEQFRPRGISFLQYPTKNPGLML